MSVNYSLSFYNKLDAYYTFLLQSILHFCCLSMSNNALQRASCCNVWTNQIAQFSALTKLTSESVSTIQPTSLTYYFFLVNIFLVMDRRSVFKYPDKHLRWSFLRKYLTAFSRSLFLQKTSSQIFDRVSEYASGLTTRTTGKVLQHQRCIQKPCQTTMIELFPKIING